MKKLFKNSPLCFIAFIVGLLIPTFFFSCNENPLDIHEDNVFSLDPEFTDKEVGGGIRDKYYDLADINVRVEIFSRRITIMSFEPFEIDSCTLFIDNEEVKMRYISKNRCVTDSMSELQDGYIYSMRLVINDVAYETDFRMPHEAKVHAPNPKNNPKHYTFTWSLEQNYSTQYVGITLKDNGLFGDVKLYLIAEIAPSDRSFSMNLDSLPSRYELRGVATRGINFVKKDNILFINNFIY